MIVAVHQADSSHAEVAPIVLRLVAAGFTMLAIDQRSGGGLFGSSNRTAAALPREASYEETLPDLAAALAWPHAEARGAPVIARGSSYSAALVFLLAAAHPADVSALVALSPGEYLDDKQAVRKAARRVTVPVFIDQASSADEVAQSAAILRALPGSDEEQFAGKAKSSHGASTLRADSNPAGAETQWQPLLKLLYRFAPGPRPP